MSLFRFFLLAVVLTLWLPATAAYTVIDGRLDGSEIYPGTVHDFKVVVPDDYDPSVPAALYLGLDGILCRAPEVIDSLSSLGEMPLTVSVYLQPGVVKDDSGATVRYNRSNEFDATDARFATFIETELIPAVESLRTSDGREIHLSRNPSDRMIFGLSSGGIAAFNAAWYRPDLFSRVFSGCGTFVPMRGGNELQAVVRKHEPLPLRVYLQDGYSDTWNPIFGSWYEANRILASALEFAGYDCAFDWAEGGHSVRRASEIFPEVMKWMWRDYPADVRAGTTGNGLLAPMLVGAGGWERVEDVPQGVAFGTSEAVYPDSTLVASATEDGMWLDQHIIGAGGERRYGQQFYRLHCLDGAPRVPRSMIFDGDGMLWVLTADGIQICDQNGRVRGILRLPAGVDATEACLGLADGAVYISAPSGMWRRSLCVRVAVPGVTPPSQGAA